MTKILDRFAQSSVFDDTSLRAVVKTDDCGMPVFWDITKGNLLLYGNAIHGVVALSGFLPLLRLLRVSENELIYYYISEGRVSEIFAEDQCCKGCGIVTEGNCRKVLEALSQEVERR